MDFFTSMKVSASGLDAQMRRMNTISSNIANAETAQTDGPGSGPYRRRDVVFNSKPYREHFGEILADKMDQNVQEVQVSEITEDTRPPKLIYNPNHPLADERGYVAMPNVNTVEEMANMVSAQRSYEANVKAMGAAKAMASKALEIGR